MVDKPNRIDLKTINHVLTVVKDVKKSMEFYCGLLGFKHIQSMVDNPDITWLQLPSGAMLHLHETDTAPVKPDNVHNAFEAADFDSAKQTLDKIGIPIERSGTRNDGQKFMFIRDPDGNLVEICTASGF